MPTTAPLCPNCNARLLPAPKNQDALWCQFCGKTIDDPEAQQRAATLRTETARNLGEYDPPGADWRIDPDLRRILNSAWADIQTGRPNDARYTLEETQRLFADSADVWYLLSLTTDDPDEKRAYLLQALAIQPHHDYAWHDQGVLNGVIPAGDAPSADPESTPAPGDTIEAKSVTEQCPICGGHIAFSAAVGATVCAHCGYQPGGSIAARPAVQRRFGYRNLEDALLQRRYGFSREWDIGARLLTCKNCGAQLTLVQDLAAICPFCDSAHILVEDAVGSFEEPDAILPFKLDRGRAAKAIHARLPDDLRPQIVRGEMWGVYLPFWMFAGVVAIALPPRQDDEESSALGARPGMYTISDALVAGITRPTQATLYDLMPYDFDALVPYDRRILSRWSAQIYHTDVIQASITARAYLKHLARRLASGYQLEPFTGLARTDSKAYNPPNTPVWYLASVALQEIHYRLVLLPVWMVTLILRDGSHRPAIVNGQTGEAIISARFDRDSIIAGPVRPTIEMLPLPEPPRRKNVIRPITPPPKRN